MKAQNGVSAFFSLNEKLAVREEVTKRVVISYSSTPKKQETKS